MGSTFFKSAKKGGRKVRVGEEAYPDELVAGLPGPDGILHHIVRELAQRGRKDVTAVKERHEIE